MLLPRILNPQAILRRMKCHENLSRLEKATSLQIERGFSPLRSSTEKGNLRLSINKFTLLITFHKMPSWPGKKHNIRKAVKRYIKIIRVMLLFFSPQLILNTMPSKTSKKGVQNLMLNEAYRTEQYSFCDICSSAMDRGQSLLDCSSLCHWRQYIMLSCSP